MTQYLDSFPQAVLDGMTNGFSFKYATIIGEAVLRADDVELAKVKLDIDFRWHPTHLHCDHPCHGVHPRYKAAYSDVYERFGHVLPKRTPEEECPKCSGDRWLPIDSEGARQQFVLAATFQMMRGVDVTPKDGDGTLNPDHVRATIAVFLSGGVAPEDQVEEETDARGNQEGAGDG